MMHLHARRVTSMRPRGMSIGATLMLALVVFTTVMALAGLSVSHLTATHGAVAATQAQFLAEGAIVRAMDEVHDDASFGHLGEEVVFTPDTAQPDQSGRVRFSGGLPTDEPLSTNNLDGSSPTGAFGTPVPRGYLHLVGIGRVGNVERRIEAMVYRTPFPYALAASGGLTADTGFDVRGASDMATFTANEQHNVPHADPASMGSQGPIVAQASSYVAGTIRSTSTVNLPSGSFVGGGVTKGRVEIPAIDVTQFKSSCLTGTAHTNDDKIRNTPLSGAHYSGVDLEVNGDVTLDNGVLYVQGDLRVAGGMRGKGSVFATGSITVENGASLDGSAEAALLAGGDVTLRGGSQRYFQGLVYSRGTFSANRLTIAGAFVAGGGDPNASVHLGPDVKVVHIASVTGFGVPGTTRASADIGECFGRWSDAWVWEGPVYESAVPQPNAQRPEHTKHPAVMDAIEKATAGNPAYALVRWRDHDTFALMRSRTISGTWQGTPAQINVNVRSLQYNFTTRKMELATPWVHVSVRYEENGQTLEKSFESTITDDPRITAYMAPPDPNPFPDFSFPFGGGIQNPSTPSIDALTALDSAGLGAGGRDIVDAMLDAQEAARTKANDLTGASGAVNLVKTDMNRFLNDVMPLHVVYWRPR